MGKKIVFLQGGLGNQMFQYAFFLSMKRVFSEIYCDGTTLLLSPQHNGAELERIFGIHSIEYSFSRFSLRVISKFLSLNNSYLRDFFLSILSLMGVSVIFDDIPSVFKSKFESNKKLSLYIGYWQTEQYFANIKPTILSSFCFDNIKKSEKTRLMQYEIENSNAVSIHIRRGDYLSPHNVLLYGNICTADYYLKAIDMIQELVDDIIFFIFSDDIEWVKTNLRITNCKYIDWNKGKDSWQDMYLMSKCKHNIIANSSFSWWAAWLNQTPQKIVISPSRFLNLKKSGDIIPSEWISI